jgi:hypothetical protein
MPLFRNGWESAFIIQSCFILPQCYLLKTFYSFIKAQNTHPMDGAILPGKLYQGTRLPDFSAFIDPDSNYKITHLVEVCHSKEAIAELKRLPKKISWWGVRCTTSLGVTELDEICEAAANICDAIQSGGVVYLRRHPGCPRSADIVTYFLLVTETGDEFFTLEEGMRIARGMRRARPVVDIVADHVQVQEAPKKKSSRRRRTKAN